MKVKGFILLLGLMIGFFSACVEETSIKTPENLQPTLGSYPVPDTGQLDCVFGSGAIWAWDINCAAQTYVVADQPNLVPMGQDASYLGFPSPRNYSPPTPHGVYTDDRVTFDQTTGLTWKTCSEGQIDPACTLGVATFPHSGGSDSCNDLNSANGGAGYYGEKGWRLPSVFELSSLVERDGSFPSINPTAFPFSHGYLYWAKEFSSVGDGTAFAVNFSQGEISLAADSTNLPVRCVSGNEISDQYFSDNDDGTITDVYRGLLWQKCRFTAVNDDCSGGDSVFNRWDGAIFTCEMLTLAGRDDWRLPNFNELFSIVDTTGFNPAINQSPFPNTSPTKFWSSTANPIDPKEALLVDFQNGTTFSSNNGTAGYYHRCVTDA